MSVYSANRVDVHYVKKVSILTYRIASLAQSAAMVVLPRIFVLAVSMDIS
jgi:hypothetical protein